MIKKEQIISDFENGLICLEDIIDFVRADATRWIPCSERLPEDEGYYLITEKSGFVTIDYFRVLLLPYIDVREFSTNAIAWMPLPEPYREEQKQ